MVKGLHSLEARGNHPRAINHKSHQGLQAGTNQVLSRRDTLVVSQRVALPTGSDWACARNPYPCPVAILSALCGAAAAPR